MIGTRSQILNKSLMYVAHRRIFADVPYTFFGVLRCHTRTSWQCLGWCNLFFLYHRPASICPSARLYLWSVKIACPPSQMVGSSPNLHTVLPRSVRIHDVLNVNVKGHPIWAILL